MPTFYSPAGNPEVWKEKPDGYLTAEEWLEANPSEMAEIIESEMPQVYVSLEERISTIEDVLLAMLLGDTQNV